MKPGFKLEDAALGAFQLMPGNRHGGSGGRGPPGAAVSQTRVSAKLFAVPIGSTLNENTLTVEGVTPLVTSVRTGDAHTCARLQQELRKEQGID